MTFRRLFRLAALAVCVTVPSFASATSYSVSGVYLNTFAESASLSTAHGVTATTTITGCANNQLYIEFTDREMFAMAMTAKARGVSVDIIYETAGASRTIYSNTVTCKINEIKMN